MCCDKTWKKKNVEKKTGFEEEIEKTPSKFREKNKFLQLPIQIPMSVFLFEIMG